MALNDRYATLPFDEAIAYLRDKISLPTDRWDDIQGSEHDAAFVVAGAKGTLLADIRTAVERAISEGQRPEEFRAAFDRIAAGWIADDLKDWRAGIIYSTNLRMSYRAGRAQHQLDAEVLKVQPYLQYVHGDSRSPRPTHLALDGKVVEAVNCPIYMPHGYGCSCRMISLTRRQLEQRGLSVSTIELGDTLPYENERGQTRQALIQPDKGFDPNPPTQPSDQRRRQMIQGIIDRTPEPLKGQMVAELAAIDQRFGQQPAVAEPPAQGRSPGIPVSDALKLPSRGAKVIRDALTAIDAVHSDGTLPQIPVKLPRNRQTGIGGSFGYLSDGTPVEISVQAGDGQAFVFAHELGHFLDFSGIGSGGHATEAGDQRMAGWRQAVENSAAIKKLRQAIADGAIEIDGELIVFTSRTQDYFEYLLRPREIWARTYSQWIAQKVGGSMQSYLDGLLTDSEAQLTQWTQEDFAAISGEIEALFRGLGWLE